MSAMAAKFIQMFPEIDTAVEGDLNAIAVAVKEWRGERLRESSAELKSARRPKRKKGDTLH
jgi:hypothetical protein